MSKTPITKINLRVFCVLLIAIFSASVSVSAQQTLGTTGTLNAPSARMQADRTAMIGGNYLNRKITPKTFNYNTLNYFVNITLLPFFEASYTCTLFRGTDRFVPEKKGKFVNQDRSVSMRLQLLKEHKYLPAIVVGGNDIFSSVSNNSLEVKSNQYFSRFYVALSKQWTLGAELFDLSAAYIYYRRTDNNLDCFSTALSYTPSITPHLNLLVEYDSRDFNIGANQLLFNHLFLQVILQRAQYLSAGVCYKIYL